MRRVKNLIHDSYEAMRKYRGQGVVVVVMDTGVAPHPDLKNRIISFQDFVNESPVPYDDNGHGTHVCGILSGRTIGIAPEARLIMLKVLDARGNGKVEQCMKGFRWIIENKERYNIRIVNISIGMEPKTNVLGERYILGAVEMLWNMGLVVVAAAGNMGPKEGSITIPGINEKIITVGSSEEQFVADEYGKRKKSYSGCGSVKLNMWKPDLVAPGSHIFSCNAKYGKYNPRKYVEKSGTSMATPIVSGAAAALLTKYPNLTNSQVKKRLKMSCDDLGMEAIRQGSGMLNLKKLLQ